MIVCMCALSIVQTEYMDDVSGIIVLGSQFVIHTMCVVAIGLVCCILMCVTMHLNSTIPYIQYTHYIYMSVHTDFSASI